MELFGKEININLDKKKIKLIIQGTTGLGVVILIYFTVVTPIKRIYHKKGELVKIEKEKKTTSQNLQLFEKRYKKIEAERANQSDRLEELLEQFKNQSLEDEAKIKQMVQDILNHLDIVLVEIGKTEEEGIEGNLEYGKKKIPYTIVGNGKDIALFFFYLENANALLTLKNSRLEMINKLFTEDNEAGGTIEVKFKLGYYNLAGNKAGDSNEN